MAQFVDFEDSTIPIGKRKQAFVKWLMSRHGYLLDEAKLLAARKFGRSEASLRSQRDSKTLERLTKSQKRGIRRWGHPSQY